jgi:hypothetical protein
VRKIIDYFKKNKNLSSITIEQLNQMNIKDNIQYITQYLEDNSHQNFLYFSSNSNMINKFNYKTYDIKNNPDSVVFSFIEENKNIFMFQKDDTIIGNIEKEKSIINKALEKKYTIIIDDVCLNQFETVLVNYGLLIDDYIKELQQGKYTNKIIITTKMREKIKLQLDDCKK